MNDSKENINNDEPESPVSAEEEARKTAANTDEPGSEDILQSRVASGIASRGGGNRIAGAMAKANKFFGVMEEGDQEQMAKMEGTALPAEEPAPKPAPTRQIVLGRGAWAALLALLFFLPLIVWMIFIVIDLNQQNTTLKQLNVKIQEQSTQNSLLVSLLNSPNIQSYKMNPSDPTPGVEVNLHTGGPRLWALTYRQTNSLAGRDRVFVLYLVKNVKTPGADDYISLVVFPGNSSGYGIIDNMPADLDPKNYSQFIVSDEPSNQEIKGKPTGLIRFTLDVSKITVNVR